MMSSLGRIVVAGAFALLASAGCKCADDTGRPSGGAAQDAPPGLVARPLVNLGAFARGDGGARGLGAARLQPSVRLHRGIASLRGPRPVRSSRVGEGTLSLALERSGAVSMLARIYKRGEVLLVAAERADLGLVLSLPTLVPGTYRRGGDGPSQPNLRVRVGTVAEAEHLHAADQVPGVTLTLTIAPPGADRYLFTGTFDGQVSRDSGQAVRRVTAGRFELRLDPNALPTDGLLRRLSK